MEKKKYRPQERLFSVVEQRAEAIAGEFKPQEVANTLWAYAPMGRNPGERLMRLLEKRAEAISGEFKPQGVLNTLGVCDYWEEARGVADVAAGGVG